MKSDDACLSHQCLNGATCTSSGITYTCLCAVGFTGVYCGSGKLTLGSFLFIYWHSLMSRKLSVDGKSADGYDSQSIVNTC